MRRVAALVAALAMALAGADAAEVCAATGRPAPDAFALTTDRSDRAIFVQPDCSAGSPLGSNRGSAYDIVEPRLERVDRVPANTASISITAPLSRGGDFTARELGKVTITSASTSAKNFAFPSSLQTLELLSTSVSDMELLAVPEGVRTVTIRKSSQFKSWKNVKLPASIERLDLSDNQLTALNFALPSKLQSLSLNGNPVANFDGLALPSSLKYLYCTSCTITSVRGTKLPSTMAELSLGPKPVTTFEIRKSDLDVLRNLDFTGEIKQSTCADTTAEIVTIAKGNVCVISDARFDELYASGPPTAPSGATPSRPLPASSSVGSGDGTTDKTGSGASDPTDASRETSDPAKLSARRNATVVAGSGEESSELSEGGGDTGLGTEASQTGDTNLSGTTSKKGSRSNTNDSGSKAGVATTNSPSSNSTTILVVIVVIGVVLAVIVGAAAYRIIASPKIRDDEDSTTQYKTVDTPNRNVVEHPETPEYLENDVRNDTSLNLYRIDASAIQLGDRIARGGFGIIYRGVFNSESVAIKRMLSETYRDKRKARRFMDEIRLCVRLDHPKIVRCIGISWTSLRDLSVVIEFMGGGDLHSVLHSQGSIEQSGREWSGKWTSRQLKSKTAIAADIADAIVYLHSFKTPVIHRDLKSKNVLMDSRGNAKLSDFGISREVPMDETMTGDIGTVAWIAPEVLRGERYSEKADIYSLGVLLVELDRCHHPYAREDVMGMGNVDSHGHVHTLGGKASQAVMKNTRIAILVSTGKLRPTASQSCPGGIKQLVDRCLSFEPAERPNSMEVYHALEQLHNAKNNRTE